MANDVGYLLKNHWIRLGASGNRRFKRIFWADPQTGKTYSQGDARWLQSERNKSLRLSRRFSAEKGASHE
jgi:hypothetical protein